MKFVYTLVVLGCVFWKARGFPYYPVYENVDTYSLGDASRGGMALSRYYNPYYNPRTGGGSIAAFMYRQPEETSQSSQYYVPDRRRQTPQDFNFNISPQQNEVFYPQQAENSPVIPTEATYLAEHTEKIAEMVPTTAKAVAAPELVETEVEEVPEEPAPKPKKTVARKKQVKRPIEEEDDDDYASNMPAGAFFPMFFGWGGRAGGGAPGTAHMAIANAYSTGRGGVATSHATAYGAPRPERS